MFFGGFNLLLGIQRTSSVSFSVVKVPYFIVKMHLIAQIVWYDILI